MLKLCRYVRKERLDDDEDDDDDDSPSICVHVITTNDDAQSR